MKSPAFQFYANEWLSSTQIALMTPAEEGAYIHLLCHAWNDPNHSIPDDDAELAALSRLGEGWFNGASQKVRKCFRVHPTIHGRLVNERMLKEAKKQADWREKSRLGGVNSAASRDSKSKGGSLVVDTKRQGTPNSSSPSSSPSSSSSPNCTSTNAQEVEQVTALYAKYPRKKARDRAFAAIRKSLKKYGFDLLMERTVKFAAYCVGKDPKYIPYPATWFNAASFNDEDLATGVFESKALPTRPSMSAEEFARLEEKRFQ